uniref:Putative secreted protein n=1 Tax=Ixodes ricinus TaxID=34613 RepID=A0A6B0TSP1_IXORI
MCPCRMLSCFPSFVSSAPLPPSRALCLLALRLSAGLTARSKRGPAGTGFTVERVVEVADEACGARARSFGDC